MLGLLGWMKRMCFVHQKWLDSFWVDQAQETKCL